MSKSAVITGASSGLGQLIAGELAEKGWEVFNWSKETGVDVSNSASVLAACERLPARIGVLINCAGINRIGYLPDFTEEDWDLVMNTNAKSIFLTTKALLDRLIHPTNPHRAGTVVNIVSNASHVPMTSSLAYNASKGAAAIMTKQLARELRKTHNITVFSVSPNKMHSTGMSEYIDNRVCELRGWTPEQAHVYQLAALPAGMETDPYELASFLVHLLVRKERHIFLNGCDIPYGA